jgi:hypothetical protein
MAGSALVSAAWSIGSLIGFRVLHLACLRWIFFLNLPVALAAALTAWRRLPDTRPQRGQPLYLRSLALPWPGIAVFSYGMSEIGNHGGSGSARMLIADLIGLVLVGLFARHASVHGKAA